MGIKFASLRHPDVVVMAPALTEAGQSQNFKLPPSAHSSPGSPVSVAFNGVKKLAVPHLLSDANLCKDRTKKFCVSEKLICQRVNGFQKLEDTRFLDPNFDAFENLTTLAIASELTKGTGEDLCAGRQKHPGEKSKGHSKEGKFIMNQCDPSMGDHQDNMGFQKPNNAVPNTECANLMKDKTLSNDMDQLLKNLGAAISGNELSSGTDLGQNVEDILQVINNMETNPPETDSMNTDNMGLGNMDPTENVEAESMFQMADGADLSTLERELLNVDMMNMCVDVNINDNTLELENKEALSAVRLEDVRKKQFELERKCEFLGRRLRKLHARSLGKHASGEVTGVLEQAYRMLQSASGKEGENSTENSDSQIVQTSGSAVVKVEPNVKEKRVKGISSSSLANLFRRLDVISQQQAAITSRQQVPHKYFGAGSGDHSTVAVSNNGISAFPKFLSETKEEVEQVSGQLHTQVEVVEHAFDSDATASSSGGESCDEMQNFNNPHQVSVSIGKRAAWRWARDRAGVASRWTWLQAQISDLEYRIRQHNEIHRQIRAAKGHVCLGEAPAGAAVAPGSGAPPPSPAPAPASAPASPPPAPAAWVGGAGVRAPRPTYQPHLHHHHHTHALRLGKRLPRGARRGEDKHERVPAATAAPSTPAPAHAPWPRPAATDSCGSVGVCGGLDAAARMHRHAARWCARVPQAQLLQVACCTWCERRRRAVDGALRLPAGRSAGARCARAAPTPRRRSRSPTCSRPPNAWRCSTLASTQCSRSRKMYRSTFIMRR
ncbi:KAT8 regulatory NSL complex subunit 1 [Gryllus bimaculatus]|nr:KAT8 regulatory NSL complex subunit 1 [Gryllus bimaculatus]